MRSSFLPPGILIVSWLALLGLLGATVLLAYLPISPFHASVAITIAVVKALIVAANFMELRQRDGLTIAFAGAGLFWLGIMLWLALADFLTRPGFPPPLSPS